MITKLSALFNKAPSVDPMIPPPQMIYTGDGDFLGIGREFLDYFIELGKLHPSDRVLDVGCGLGRMAIPLTQYLTKKGRYEGFDIVPQGVEWCRERITPSYPNFHFQLADIHNTSYNPEGKIKACDFEFAYSDRSFDFVFLVSVFTHMLPLGLEHYLSEIARVLDRKGSCLITFFLLNDAAKRCIDGGLSTLDFKYDSGLYRVVDQVSPEAAVCYDETFILGLLGQNGLRVNQPIHYGSWCGRENYLSYQDILVATHER